MTDFALKSPSVKEGVVVSTCIKLMEFYDLKPTRNNTFGVPYFYRTKDGEERQGWIRGGRKGSSDILGVTKDGRTIAVECKRETGGMLSDAQKQYLADIEGRGGVALVVHSARELEQKLKAAGVI